MRCIVYVWNCCHDTATRWRQTPLLVYISDISYLSLETWAVIHSQLMYLIFAQQAWIYCNDFVFLFTNSLLFYELFFDKQVDLGSFFGVWFRPLDTRAVFGESSVICLYCLLWKETWCRNVCSSSFKSLPTASVNHFEPDSEESQATGEPSAQWRNQPADQPKEL